MSKTKSEFSKRGLFGARVHCLGYVEKTHNHYWTDEKREQCVCFMGDKQEEVDGEHDCDLYRYVDTAFDGIAVGTTILSTKLNAYYDTPYYGREGYVVHKSEPGKFVIVYYRNNRKRLVPLDKLEKEIVTMPETNKRPRLCDILGVEVDEHFTIKGATLNGTAIIYYIQPDGRFAAIPSRAVALSDYIMDAINDPALVKHIEPTFSDDEKGFLSIMKRLGFEWLSRDVGELVTFISFWGSQPIVQVHNDKVTIFGGGGSNTISMPVDCLPCVKPGDVYSIDEVLQRGGTGNEQS